MTIACLAVAASPGAALAQGDPRAGAGDDCGPTPARYRQQEYGEVVHALEASCIRTFSPLQQLFVVGLSQALLSECGSPDG